MTVRGSCHCKATTFELSEPPEIVTRCNCTFCTKRGVLWAYYGPDQVSFSARQHEATYGKKTFPIVHHHCSVCGCGTYTESPVWEDGKPDLSRTQIGINVRLLDDFDLEPLPVEELDGRNMW